MHPRENNSQHRFKLRGYYSGSCHADWDLGRMVDNKLNRSSQCNATAKKGQCYFEMFRQYKMIFENTRGDRELLFTPVKSHLELPGPLTLTKTAMRREIKQR